MTSLVEFLLARIAEDEAAAERLELCPYFGVDVGSGHVHISRARAMAECEAKRRIVELHNRNHECSQYDHTGDIDNCTWFVLDEDGCSSTRLLALPHADHDDYREEWRP